MRLFDQIERDYLDPSEYAEPDFTYYNRSARPAMAKIRDLSEAWFEHYPVQNQSELRQRFRSTDDWQHRSAFFELFLHELLLSLGCTVNVHPITGTGKGKRPDFLVESPDCEKLYIEAVIASEESREDTAARARMNHVYDALNRMRSPDFFLYMKIKGSPKSPPPVKRIRSFLTKHLDELDPDAVGKLLQSDSRDKIPHWSFKHEGLEIIFHPIPKSPHARGKPGVRPIGVQFHAARMARTEDAVRDAVLKKAGRYGKLNLPYLIAVNVLCDTVDKIDIESALFGTERMTIPFGLDRSSEQIWTRAPDGGLTGGSGCRYTRVSGVLVVNKLKPSNVSRAKMCLYHNPSADKPYTSELTRLPQAVAPDGANVEYLDGECLEKIFDLPASWPEG